MHPSAQVDSAEAGANGAVRGQDINDYRIWADIPSTLDATDTQIDQLMTAA